MPILFNYLYSYILELIINRVYKDGDRYYQNNNEVIQLSCVCRDWFGYVSQILGIKLKESLFDRMLGLIQLSEPINEKSSFKLIQFKDSIMVYNDYQVDDDGSGDGDGGYFNKLQLLDMFKSSSKFKKVYIIINNSMGVNIVLDLLDQIPDNVIVQVYGEFFNRHQFVHYSKYSHKIHSFYCSSHDITGLHRLLENPPKILSFSVSNGYWFLFNHFRLKFKSSISTSTSTTKSVSTSKLSSSIDIDDLVFPLESLSQNINASTSKLNKFYLYTDISSMLDSVPVLSNDTLVKWSYIVNKLSTDKTLKDFTFKLDTTKSQKKILNELDLYGGLKSILSRQQSLLNFNIDINTLLHDLLLDGLALNRSIKNLEVHHYFQNIKAIINRVLLSNRTSIRNLTIIVGLGSNYGDADVIGWLSYFCNPLYKNQLDLYSVSIQFKSWFCLTPFINFIGSNSFQVKVFNLYSGDGKVKYQILTRSGSLINITQ